MECFANNEKVHLAKEDLALSNTKIENWFTQHNKWLAVVLIASFIAVLSFVVGMIMVKKWFSFRNTVTTINAFVSKVEKQITGPISLLNKVRGGETVSLNDCQKEYVISLQTNNREYRE